MKTLEKLQGYMEHISFVEGVFFGMMVTTNQGSNEG